MFQNFNNSLNTFDNNKVDSYIVQCNNKECLLEMAVEEKERVHSSQLQRSEREIQNLKIEIKKIKNKIDSANIKAAESDKLRQQIDQRYYLLLLTNNSYNLC